jgi:hypothetical protein
MRVTGTSALRDSGALISGSDALELSTRLCALGDQWESICAELQAAGYSAASAIARDALLRLADTTVNRLRLQAYWREWAKERLAALAGPINILKGRYPKHSAYRSPLMAQLRDDVASGKTESVRLIKSPQIEPTLKLNMERGVDYPEFPGLHNRLMNARSQSAMALGLVDIPEFVRLNKAERYNLLTERYKASLCPAGFRLDSHRKTGLVFRKLTSNKRWAFLMIDVSQFTVDTGSLSTSFGITLPKKGVLPALRQQSCVAEFLPEDLVPQYNWSSGFACESYAEFCLATDSIAFLAKVLYERINALIGNGYQATDGSIL